MYTIYIFNYIIWQFEWIALKASSWDRPGTPSPKTLSHTSIIIISSLKTKLESIKISILMSRSFCINFYIFTENSWKLIMEGFQAWYFYGLRSFRFFYKDHTISSVTREMWPLCFSFLLWKASVSFLKVKFSLAKILVLTGNLYFEKSLESFWWQHLSDYWNHSSNC